MSAINKYPTINMTETGLCIYRHICQAGLSVRDLQEYFGFEYPQAIYKWLNGKSLPKVDNLFALARLLQVPMDSLLVCNDREVSPSTREGPTISSVVLQISRFFGQSMNYRDIGMIKQQKAKKTTFFRPLWQIIAGEKQIYHISKRRKHT